MFKTISYHYKCNKNELSILRFLCHISKNVYNVALYELRQAYLNTKTIPTYFDLNKLVLKNINSHIINTYQTLCIDRLAYNSMNTFVKYNMKNNNVKLPKYLNKYGYYPLVTDQIRIKEMNNKKYIKLPISNLFRTKRFLKEDYSYDSLLSEFVNQIKDIDIKDIYFKIPKEIYSNKIHQLRIIPDKYGEYFKVEFSYSYEENKEYEGNTNISLGIDIGISNLATCITNIGNSFIIDGKYLKSINVLYNKRISQLKSKLNYGIYTSKRIRILERKRNLKIEDYINKAVNEIMTKSKELKVSKIIIGWNKGLKTNGIKNDSLKGKDKRRINQTFIQIPLSRFKNKIVEKCKNNNIDVLVINESYTSKSSALDNDLVKKGLYSGKRIKRGLYKTKEGNIINSDINAAINMIRKCNSNEVNLQMSRGLTSPLRVYVRL